MRNLFLLILIAIVVSACGFRHSSKQDKSSATLFLVHDNYPKGYKKAMGELSYTRNVLLVFSIKNLTSKTISLPISNIIDSDTSVVIKVTGCKESTDVPCTYYWRHDKIISVGDSLVVAIRLRTSDMDKIGIDLDEKTIEHYIQELKFECCQKKNGVLKGLDTDIEFKLSPKIIYKYGRLFIEYHEDGIKKEKEIYEDSSDIAIAKKSKDRIGGTGY